MCQTLKNVCFMIVGITRFFVISRIACLKLFYVNNLLSQPTLSNLAICSKDEKKLLVLACQTLSCFQKGTDSMLSHKYLICFKV